MTTIKQQAEQIAAKYKELMAAGVDEECVDEVAEAFRQVMQRDVIVTSDADQELWNMAFALIRAEEG